MSSGDEVLHEVAKKGTADQLENVLDQLRAQLGGEDPSAVLRHVLGRRDDKKYTILQNAIFGRNLAVLPGLLAAGCDVNAKCFGTPCIHIAVSVAALPDGYDFGMAALKLLLGESYANVLAKDDQGQSALHLACEYDLPEVATLLLDSGCDLAETLTALRDRTKGTALHKCAARNSTACAQLLLARGSDTATVDHLGNTPLHLASHYDSGAVRALLVKATSKEAAALTNTCNRTAKDEADLSLRGQGTAEDAPRTVVLTNELCRQHFTCPPAATDTTDAPPENLRRLSVILDEGYGCLRSGDMNAHLAWIENCRKADINDVLRVHEWPWVRYLQSKCEALEEDADGVGGLGNLDGDTTVSKYTFEAALAAAGSCCQAVDLIMSKEHKTGASVDDAARVSEAPIRNAFCAVRPPGHHAGPKGLVASDDGGPDSHGFCLLNNVSIGAAYALNVHRDHVKKVCIVDFDVHHGNGTEETVRWLKPGVDHQTVSSPHVFGSLALPRYKPWHSFDDAENVLFVSVHGFGPRSRGLEYAMPAAAFYPGTGDTKIPDLAPPSPLRPNVSSAEARASTSATHKQKGFPVGDDNDEGEGGSSAAAASAAAQSIEVVFEARDTADGGDDDDADAYEYNDPHVGDDGDDDFDAPEGDEEDGEGHGSGDGDGDSSSAGSVSGAGVDMDGGDSRLAELRQTFYGGSGKGAGPAAADSMPPLIMDIGVRLPPTDDPVGNYRHQWRNYFRDEIFPRINEFSPDMIFISAGFDAHKRDDINGGYIALVEEDYEWATTHLQRLANSNCDGRLVSVLEGGYQIGGEHMSAFAKSVKSHVVSLTRGARLAHRGYSAADLAYERNSEADTIAAMEAKRQAKLAEQQRTRDEAEAAANAARMASLQEMADAAAGGGDGDGGGDGLAEEERAYIKRIMAAEAAEAAEAAAARDTGAGADAQPTKRRRASKPVDYAALDMEMREKEGK